MILPYMKKSGEFYRNYTQRNVKFFNTDLQIVSVWKSLPFLVVFNACELTTRRIDLNDMGKLQTGVFVTANTDIKFNYIFKNSLSMPDLIP